MNRSERANSHSTIFPAIPPTVPAAKSAMALRRAGEETKFPEKESAFDASELISVAFSELNDNVDTLDRTPFLAGASNRMFTCAQLHQLE